MVAELLQRSSFLSKVLKEIGIIFLTVIRIFGVPVMLIFAIPIYTWRQIVSWLSQFLRPDLVKMVVTRSSIMAVDDWMTQPKCNLVVTIGFEGELNMDLFFAEIDEKVLSKKNHLGEELHPEMKQYYEEWLGFIFWKYEQNFNIPNHMSYYDTVNSDRPITTAQLTEIEAEMTSKPFTPKKSPWEVLYIRNFKPDFDKNPHVKKSLIIFRLHHGIADGYSLLNLLLKEICQLHEHEYALPNYPQKSFSEKFRDKVKFALKSQYEAARQHIDCYDQNDWRIPKYKMSNTWYHFRSNDLPIQMLKEIKDAYKVSFTSMLIGGISGGIRRYLIKKGKVVPEKMHCVAPFPVPGHTTKLRNFFTFAFLTFPVGIEDPGKRLKKVEKCLTALKSSTTPLSNFLQLPIVGGLSSGMIRIIARNLVTTALMSNFPGPFKQCTFMGLPVTEIGFTGGLLRGNQGIGFAMLSYLGNLNIRLIGCKSLFPDQSELKDLMEEIEKEFHWLWDSVQV